VLCRPGLVSTVGDLVFRETGTLGMRVQPVTKHVLPRHFESVLVRGRSIAMKVGPYGAKPEYDDLAMASESLEIPVRQLAAEAVSAFAAHNEFDTPVDGSASVISNDRDPRPNS
ncbi:MAG: nickel insertion protein, partial [Acidimicrobiales bacterium]